MDFLDERHFAYTTLFADDIHGWDGSPASLGGGAGFANVTFLQPRVRVAVRDGMMLEGSATLLRTNEERTVGTGPRGDRPATGAEASNDLGVELDVSACYALQDGGELGASFGWFRPGDVYGAGAPNALKGEVWMAFGF